MAEEKEQTKPQKEEIQRWEDEGGAVHPQETEKEEKEETSEED